MARMSVDRRLTTPVGPTTTALADLLSAPHHPVEKAGGLETGLVAAAVYARDRRKAVTMVRMFNGLLKMSIEGEMLKVEV
jgi:hypothetical protein